MSQTIETSIAYISLTKNGIVRVEGKENVTANLESLEENYRVFSQLLKGKSAPFIIIFHPDSLVSREAMKEFASKERMALKKAEAIVMKTLAHRLLFNFHIRFFKPKQPTRVFSTEEKAMKWLKRYST